MFEKALDACATSPYGKPVSHWILAGALFNQKLCIAVAVMSFFLLASRGLSKVAKAMPEVMQCSSSSHPENQVAKIMSCHSPVARDNADQMAERPMARSIGQQNLVG